MTWATGVPAGTEGFINPFATDGTQKYPFEKFLTFHLEGKGCPDTYERRDYEALAG